MLRKISLSIVIALALPLSVGAASIASAAPDTPDKVLLRGRAAIAKAAPQIVPVARVAQPTRPKQPAMTAKDAILYNIISDQITEMRRKSALPAVMCIAESADDGSATTISRSLMTRLEADNAQVEDSLFTLKAATECESAGHRFVDRETHERAMMIVAGPMEEDMRGLMSGCGDFVGGFVRASDDSDFDFYTVNGGAVARKLGCDLAR
jgi:hypothetical protein